MSTPRIDCLFYSDPTLPVFLREPEARPFVGDLFVEVASRPALAYALQVETPPAHPGLAGLLGGLAPAALSLSTPLLPAPILLAPGTPPGAAALRAGLAALRSRHSGAGHVTLLVPMDEAALIGAALAIADRHAIAWNATAHLQAEHLAFAQWLGAEGLLTGGAFAGFFPYAPELLDGVAAAHLQTLGALFAPHATAHPAWRASVLVPSG